MPYSGTTDIISSVLTDYHQVSEAKVLTSTYGPHRDRMLRALQRIVAKVYLLRDWTFRYMEDTYEVAANAWAGEDLWAVYGNEGQEGFVQMVDEPKNILVWLRPSEIRKMIQLNPDPGGDPRYYSVTNVQPEEPRKIIIYPYRNTTVTLLVRFHVVGLTLIGTDPPGSPGGLYPFPTHWTDLLYEMLVEKEMVTKGDVQSVPIQHKLIEDMTYDMVCTERQGKPEPEMLPRYAGSSGLDEFMWTLT